VTKGEDVVRNTLGFRVIHLYIT